MPSSQPRSAAYIDAELRNAGGTVKPNPRFYAKVAEAAGSAPAKIVFVGDTLAKDVTGPRASGMRAVLVNAGPPPQGCPEDVPVITHVAGLPPLLERWP
ncbi:HAD family hydrolase [Micromonospora craniellae]|uniref:HAD family hydrolase n=1 Tax=Micromonospora craniellae TaxID=2294034 RepID=A0A372FQK4_9ACTN|nr:HAD family hydrolase [Micromonospora craniellae]RFS40943.1 HAD family hydrolase [Micromonospora craniellae]